MRNERGKIEASDRQTRDRLSLYDAKARLAFTQRNVNVSSIVQGQSPIGVKCLAQRYNDGSWNLKRKLSMLLAR